MKKTIMAMIAVLTTTLLVGACGNSKLDTEVLSTIEEITEKSNRLENGRFETLTSIANETEKSDQKAEGSFIETTYDEYDWYYKELFEGEGSSIELVNINGDQFQKTSIDSQTSSDWVAVPETISSFKDTIGSLFNYALSESEIEDIEVNEKEANTQYKLTLNDSYSDKFKK